MKRSNPLHCMNNENQRKVSRISKSRNQNLDDGGGNVAEDIISRRNISGGCSLKIEWMNSREAADFLRLSIKALRNLTSRGKVPFYKLGRSNRYRKDELEDMLLRERRGQYGN